MALLRYLQFLPRCGQLPDPTGTLSSSLPSSAIDEANASARQEATKTKRGPYHSHERNTLSPYFSFPTF